MSLRLMLHLASTVTTSQSLQANSLAPANKLLLRLKSVTGRHPNSNALSMIGKLKTSLRLVAFHLSR